MQSTVAIIGAGPIGLELAIALKQTKIPYVQFDKGQVAQMTYDFPPQTRYFSSSERISIAGIPIQTIDQQKCPREEYLAYIRSVVMQFNLKVNTYEEVTKVERLQTNEFHLTTVSSKGERHYQVQFLVIATGGTSFPRRLGIPGEDLPHVSTKMEDPHKYFQTQLVVIGGKNSAIETALRCFQAGSRVSLVHHLDQIDPQHVKYWLLPEFQGRIERNEMKAYFNSRVVEILPDRVKVDQAGTIVEVSADFVIKAIGFKADMSLFHALGIKLADEQEAVLHDEFMQTNIPNAYVLGTVVAGTQQRYRIFIENSHEHVDCILKDICAKLSIKSSWKGFQKPAFQRVEE